MKLKPVLIIVVTLLIGFLLGVLTSAQLRQKRMRSVRIFSSERYFRNVIYKVIEPTEEQQEVLDPVIKNFGKEGKELQREFMKEFSEHNKKYWEEIRSLLTEEQINLLEEMNKKNRDEMRHFRPDSTRRGSGRRGQHNRQSRDSVPEKSAF